MDFRHEIVRLLDKATKLDRDEVEKLLSVPPDPKLGDYAFPCFQLGKNPKEAAESLKKKFPKTKLPEFIEKLDTAGPYLNFYIKHSTIAEETLSKIFKEKKNYGKQKIGNNKKIVIDFSSPNIAKPFGIGHLRSTVIGNSLYKTYHFLGYKPVGVNHLGDWGTQFGKLIVAYQKWGKEKQLEKDPIKYLLKLYVKFHAEAEKNEKLVEQAREEFKKLEDGDKNSLALWETFRDLSLAEFQKVYQMLEVDFDSYHGEAFYNDKMEAAIDDLQRKAPLTESEGALIVDLEAYKMPPVLIKKSNKSTTYHTRDIAAASYRLKEYTPTKMLYVVGADQKLHFRQLFKVLDLAQMKKSEFVHVDFGMIKFPEGKMSTRKGNLIFLEEVLDKSIKLAEKIIEEKNPDLNNKSDVAKMVGIGAIIFADLSNDRTRNINFDWNRMLSFEGETAPYLQYTHARACSILRKVQREYRKGPSAKVNFELYSLAEEQALVKKLYEFPEIIVRVADTYKPHHLAQYLIGLAQQFNEFYHKCPVISEQDQQMKARLLLVDSTRQVLENGLKLLGIKAPEEM